MAKFITTNQDKIAHGLGFENIEAVVVKYNGTMEIELLNEFFVANIILYPENCKFQHPAKNP